MHRFLANDVQRLLAGRSKHGAIAGRLDDLAQGFAAATIIVGDQDRVWSLGGVHAASSPPTNLTPSGTCGQGQRRAKPIRTAGKKGRLQTAYRPLGGEGV